MEQPDPAAPIISTLAQDPDRQEAIDAFVIGLGECIDAMQDDQLAGALGALARRAHALNREAARLGYAPLSQAALDASRACEVGEDEALRKRLLELTEIARRVRLGHRSSA